MKWYMSFILSCLAAGNLFAQQPEEVKKPLDIKNEILTDDSEIGILGEQNEEDLLETVFKQIVEGDKIEAKDDDIYEESFFN